MRFAAIFGCALTAHTTAQPLPWWSGYRGGSARAGAALNVSGAAPYSWALLLSAGAAVNAVMAAPVLSPGGAVAYVTGHDGVLRAVNVTDGSVLWTRNIAAPTSSTRGVPPTPAVCADGTIFTATVDAGVSAITPAGALLWNALNTRSLDCSFVASPVLSAAGDVVILVSQLDLVYALHTANGSIAWTYAPIVGTYGLPAPSLAASGDIIFAANFAAGRHGAVFALAPGGASCGPPKRSRARTRLRLTPRAPSIRP